MATHNDEVLLQYSDRHKDALREEGRVAPTIDTPGGSTPSQYALPEGAVELQDLIEYREMNFAVGNIFKAAYRLHVKHDSAEYDLNKIIFFAEREKKRMGFK